MRKLTGLTGLAIVSLSAALFAQDTTTETVQGVSPEQMQTALQAQNQSFQQQNEQLQQQIADLSAKLDEVSAATPAEPVAPVEEKKEEKKYPAIKHSGDIGFTPRMELNGGESGGKKIEDGINRRRLILAWNYKLSVAINEKLDLNFWLADPEDGATIAGSGKNAAMLTPALRNASFTWKPASAFNLSGGLLNVAGTAVDLATVIETADPTKSFSNVYFTSLAGFNFAFPVSSSFKAFVTAGIADNTHHNDKTVDEGGIDYKAYSDARIVVGADISLADKKVSLKPAVQILTRGDLLVAADAETGTPASINDERSPLIAEALDMSFKIASPFSLNVAVGAAHDTQSDDDKNMLFNAAIEPVLNFGGESGKLFNFRAKYGMYMGINQADVPEGAEEPDNAMIHHIDTRFGIAVNPKLSIVPRFRLWSSNNSSWFNAGSDDNAKTLSRLELGFNASF